MHIFPVHFVVIVYCGVTGLRVLNIWICFHIAFLAFNILHGIPFSIADSSLKTESWWCQLCYHWRQTPEAVIVTASSTTSEDKVAIMTTLGFQCCLWCYSLIAGRSRCDFKNAIFYLLLIGIFKSSLIYAHSWMPQDHVHVKSALVEVMAWCRQAASHYLSQCCLSFLLPYGVTRPQWVN